MAALVSRAHRLEALLATVAVVLVSRLVVANATFIPDELLALMLLLPMVLLTHRLTPQPRRALLMGGMLVLLLADSFAPFRLSAETQTFDWWPFKVWWTQSPVDVFNSIDWTHRLRRLFLFGALLWALKDWGWTPRISAAAVLSLALIVSIVHRWQPEQQASITEPLFIGSLIVLFAWADKKASRRFATSAISQHVRNR
jgi:hypothetical protein